MGACATKSGDLKVKGEAPLVVEDAAAPPVAAGEKAKGDGVPAAPETDTADAGRRRSLSDLLREDEETSDGGSADQEADKVSLKKEAEKAVIEEAAATAADDTGATKESEAPVQPPAEAEKDTAEELGDPKENQELRGGEAQVVEEEKRVDPDSVQVAAAAAAAVTSAEERQVTDDDAST